MANTIVTQRDTQLERQRLGYIQLSLTNFDNDNEPAIAAGSVVEISGSLYSFTGNESITGWAGITDGAAWIKLVPDGTDPCTAEFTQVAPTWNDAKQGWYDGTGTDRYIAGLTKNGAAGYEDKYLIKISGSFDEVITGNKKFLGNIVNFPFIDLQNVELVSTTTYTGTGTRDITDVGVFYIYSDTGTSIQTVRLEIKDNNGDWHVIDTKKQNEFSGAWFTSGIASLIFSDGTNYRLNIITNTTNIFVTLVRISAIL